MDIIIRALEAKDVPEVSSLEKDIFSMPWSAQDFFDLLERSYCHYLVAVVGDSVVGFAGMTDMCHEGNIDKVMVASAQRGKGIAARLLQELIALGDRLGMNAYTLEVRVSNQPAIHLYEKMGFVNEGIRPKFYEKPMEDAMIMWRRH